MKHSTFLLLLLVAGAAVWAAEKTQPTWMQATRTSVATFLSSDATLEAGFPFSDAVLVGDTLYMSGMIGVDEDNSLVKGGIRAETHAIFKHLKHRLASQHLDLGHVVKCLVMLDDIDQWADFNKVYMGYFRPPYPARSALGADGLALGAAVEMECIAVVP